MSGKKKQKVKRSRSESSQNECTVNIMDLLPAEIWLQVISYLDVDDKCRVARYCRFPPGGCHLNTAAQKKISGQSHNAQCFYVILDQPPIMHNAFIMTRINSANFLHTAEYMFTQALFEGHSLNSRI